MKNLLILVSILGIIVISGSVFYQFVIFLPAVEAQKQEDIEAVVNMIVPTSAQQGKQEESMVPGFIGMLKSIGERQ